VSAIASLFKYLDGKLLTRLVKKFVEKNFEKVERLLEIHERYLAKVEYCDVEMKVTVVSSGVPVEFSGLVFV